MAEHEVSDTFANRAEPLTVLSVTDHSAPSTPNDTPRAGFRQTIRESSPAAKLREKLEGRGHSRSRSDGQGSSLQDRMFAMLFQQILPTDDVQDDAVKDYRSRKYVDRPGFSPVVMGNNFRRFNQR